MDPIHSTPSSGNSSSRGSLPCVEVAGQSLMLFEESPPLIASMVDDIRAARERV